VPPRQPPAVGQLPSVPLCDNYGWVPTRPLRAVRRPKITGGQAMAGTRRFVRTASLAIPLTALLVVAAGRVQSGLAAPPVPGSPTVVEALAQDPGRPPQEVKVTARKYAFAPSRIEVQENDLVKVTLEAVDIPHSFTIDDDNYRIAKRATPGHPVVFEFRADKVGTFPFYCNLTTDPNCRTMRGELVVRPKR
jgi:cytochrome c oxidase subunit II